MKTENLFVPYTIALTLKEKGFDEPCIAEYLVNKTLSIHEQRTKEYMSEESDKLTTYTNKHSNWVAKYFSCSAPLFSQVCDWLREEHNLNIEVIWMNVDMPDFTKGYSGRIKSINQTEHTTETLADYYQALTQAIEKALTLI